MCKQTNPCDFDFVAHFYNSYFIVSINFTKSGGKHVDNVLKLTLLLMLTLMVKLMLLLKLMLSLKLTLFLMLTLMLKFRSCS